MPKKFVKRARRPVKRNYRKRTGKGYATKADVKKMMSRNLENKIFYQNAQEDQISNALITAPYFNQINYQPHQGVGQSGRIGNKITHKSGTLKGTIHFRDFNSLNNSRQLAQLVTLVVFKIKNYQTGINPTYLNFFSKMLQLGDSSIGLTNTPIDQIRKLNTDIMTVKAIRRFKMGFASGQQGITAANTVGAAPVPNNDFSYQRFFSINLNKAYKKTQIFNDTTVDANNDNLFFMVYTCPADGNAFTSTPLSITWDLELNYEDA